MSRAAALRPAEPMLPLVLPKTRTFEEWSNLGGVLLAGRRKIDWLIGDWLIAGSERYGDRAKAEAQRIFQSDVDRFAPIVEVCRRFPEPQRHAALTFGHHLAVMAVEDDAEAQRLLGRAECDGLTTAALKAVVRVATDYQPRMIEDDDPEDTGYRRIAQAWNLASRASRESFLESARESHLGVIDL